MSRMRCDTCKHVQMFTGPKLQAWSDLVPAWPVPIQAHTAFAVDCPHCCVICLPPAAVQDAVRMMEQAHLQRVMDACCQVSSFRHMTMLQISAFAQCCLVRPGCKWPRR